MTAPVTKTSKHTLTLLTRVYEALKRSALQQGIEPNELIQHIIVEHVIANKTLDPITQKHIFLGRWLIDRAIEIAKQRCRDGLFASTITLDTFRACCADPKWIAEYESYVGDNPYRNRNPLKGINREIGYSIRRAIGGEVMKQEGRPVNVKIRGEIIQSYTQMENYSPSVVSCT